MIYMNIIYKCSALEMYLLYTAFNILLEINELLLYNDFEIKITHTNANLTQR